MLDISTMTVADLEALIASATAELAKRTPPASNNPIRIAQSCGGYNARRYSRPWIGKVTSWPVGGRPEIEWGRYCGDDSGGELEIMARPGDIIRTGQKDNRGNGGSNDWYVVQTDGALSGIDQPEARKLYGGGR